MTERSNIQEVKEGIRKSKRRETRGKGKHVWRVGFKKVVKFAVTIKSKRAPNQSSI